MTVVYIVVDSVVISVVLIESISGLAVVVLAFAATAAFAASSAAAALAVDRLKSATIKKYEATAAIVC